MRSTMQDAALTTTSILRYAQRVFADSTVATYDGAAVSERSVGAVAEGARRLAAGLRGLGVRADDRVATLCWNHSRHLEAYYAVPGSEPSCIRSTSACRLRRSSRSSRTPRTPC